MRKETTSVLIVGGGLAGLSTAMFLSARGVPAVLVERHPGSSAHPRAVGFRRRSVELFRSVGLESKIPAAPRDTRVRRMRVESLAGPWHEELHWSNGETPAPAIEYSPSASAGIAQDRLEPILRERAAELGADVRMCTELVSFEQDSDAVRAVVRDRDGTEYEVQADYLVGADGHRSPVREALGIERSGRGYLRTARSVLFRAELEEYLRDGISQFRIDQPGFSPFLVTYGDGRWMLMLHDDVERDEAALRSLITRAIGRSDVEIDIITTGRWEVTFSIADEYARERVFLVGDAAHTLPPSRGGYGANIGIEDAHNLSWKLAAVLSGESGPGLLETYDAERRPVAWLCHQQIFAHDDGHDSELGKREPVLPDAAMELGLLYRSGSVIGASAHLPPAARPDEWAGQPGTRAPHVRLSGGEGRLSTLDLFQGGWVLLAEDARWSAAAEEAADRTGVAVDCRVVGGAELRPDNPDGFRRAFGIDGGGAALVRPDGYIAWRSADTPVQPERALADALGRAAFAALHGVSSGAA